jgi:hypothetical protein
MLSASPPTRLGPLAAIECAANLNDCCTSIEIERSVYALLGRYDSQPMNERESRGCQQQVETVQG